MLTRARTDLLATALLSFLCLTASASGAQNNNSVEEIHVTATRSSDGSRPITEAVTVVDKGALSNGQIQLVSDALRAQTGVFVQQTTAGQGTAIVRGLKGSEVLHLVDGIRLNNALFRNAPNQYLALVDPFITQRVDVVRGPLSTLYGSDAMGGVLQVLTSTPFLGGGEWRAESRWLARYDGATLGRVGHAGFVAGAGRVGLGGSMSYQDHDDLRGASRRAQAPTGYRSRAAHGFVTYRASDTHEWRFSVQALEQPRTPRFDELVPGFGQDEASSEAFFFEPNSRLLLHAEHRSGGHAAWLDKLEIHAAMQSVSDDRRTRDVGSFDERREQNDSRLYGLTLRGAALPGAVHGLTYGLDAYFDRVGSARQSVDIRDGTTESVQPRFPDGSEILNVDVYVQDTMTFDSAWSVSLGGRVSRSEVDLAGDATRAAASIDNTDASGSFGLRFQVNEQLALVGNLGRGFRAPNIFDLGTLGARPGNRFNTANPQLGPETVVTLDAGLKWSGHRTRAEAFLWYSDYQNKITSVSTGEVDASGRDVVQSRNAQAVTLRGAELALSHDFDSGLSAELGGNYTWGETRASAGVTEPADRIPPFNGHAAARYALERWWLEGRLRFAADQGRLSARDVRDPRINPRGTPGWGVLDLRGGAVLTPRFTLTGAINNLNDKAYREHGSGLDAPGRSVTLTVEGRF